VRYQLAKWRVFTEICGGLALGALIVYLAFLATGCGTDAAAQPVEATPCTAVEDAGCVVILCPGSEPVDVCNGSPGEPGAPGEAGMGCQLWDTPDGIQIQCGGNSAEVSDGANGVGVDGIDGTSCIVYTLADGVQIDELSGLKEVP